MTELLLSSSCRVSMLQTASYSKNDSLSFKVLQLKPMTKNTVFKDLLS